MLLDQISFDAQSQINFIDVLLNNSVANSNGKPGENVRAPNLAVRDDYCELFRYPSGHKPSWHVADKICNDLDIRIDVGCTVDDQIFETSKPRQMISKPLSIRIKALIRVA